VERLGKPFNEVHKYLDGLFDYKTKLLIHRIERHHMGGVEYCRSMWGDEAAQAAKIHIQRDFGLLDADGVTLDLIPKDKAQSKALLEIWIEDCREIHRTRKALQDGYDPLGYNQEDPYGQA